MADSLVATRRAKSPETALESYLEDNAEMLIPGNTGRKKVRLDCGHHSIAISYKAVKA